MGDRGSISVKLKDTNEESVVLFRHWKGDLDSMINLCKRARKEHIKERKTPPFDDISEIIARLTKISVEEIGANAYLFPDKYHGDNSDNGHFVLEIEPDRNREPGRWMLYSERQKIRIDVEDGLIIT